MYGFIESLARERHDSLLREAEQRRLASAAERSRSSAATASHPGPNAHDRRGPFRLVFGVFRWVIRA